MMLHLLEDRRLGGQTRYYLGDPSEALMRVPDKIRECVAFLCVRDKEGNPRYAGTAFFVTRPSEAMPEMGFVYLITAKHTITGLQADDHEAVYLRLNTIDGSYKLIETRLRDWVIHDVPSADVAALPFLPPPDFDHRPFNLQGAATDDVIDKYKIGIGDEVFIVGLFVSHVGKQRNIPIVRIGTIAAMPEEPIETRMGAMQAYLLELRSIGGLSGSPVFVYLDPFRHPDSGKFWLLGPMHGHWNVDKVSEATLPLEEDLEDEKVNMGIALVPPVSIITEVLDMGELPERRKEIERQRREKSLPDMDSTSDKDKALTKEGFNDALRRVSRRVMPSEPDGESSGT